MSPFIIKRNKKNNNRIFGKVPTYKKHRDDDVPELESDSDTSSSDSSVASSPVANKKRKTAAANMVVGKIAEALASSVIAAAIANRKGKGDNIRIFGVGSSSGLRRKLRREESENEDDDDEAENDDDSEDIENSEDDDSDEDDEDSEDEGDSDDEDSDDYDDDCDSEDSDDESDDSSEADIARNKKQQKEMEQQCEKNKNKLEEVKATIQSLTETMAANPALANNKFMKKQVEEMKQKQRDIEYQLRTAEKKRDRLNVKEFKTLLRKKNSTNDLRFFRRHMTPAEQQKVIADLKQIHAVSIIQKPYRLSLLETDIPIAFKAIAMRKINSLRHMEPGCGEYYKVKNWVDTFMKIPFGKIKNLPLTIEDGLARCSEFMEASKTTLDTAVYGLNDAKLQIMQMVGQWISNPPSRATSCRFPSAP